MALLVESCGEHESLSIIPQLKPMKVFSLPTSIRAEMQLMDVDVIIEIKHHCRILKKKHVLVFVAKHDGTGNIYKVNILSVTQYLRVLRKVCQLK